MANKISEEKLRILKSMKEQLQKEIDEQNKANEIRSKSMLEWTQEEIEFIARYTTVPRKGCRTSYRLRLRESFQDAYERRLNQILKRIEDLKSSQYNNDRTR